MNEDKINQLAKTLTRQIDKEIFEKKYAPAKAVLKLVAAGAFIISAMVMPGLPLVLKPFIDEKRKEEYEIWKRFNIPYLKRTLLRLEKQKLVEITEKNNKQIVKITSHGKQKIIKMALDEITIEKPKVWDRKWRLISFDLPEKLVRERKRFVEYLRAWRFYPLHESVYLHAYPCLEQVEFLREYMNIGEYVRSFLVAKIENDQLFKDFFGI